MDGRDNSIWSCSTDGSFSVASFFCAISGSVLSLKNIACLWNFQAPPRVLAFGWFSLLGGILTKDNLQKKKMTDVNACQMCLEDAESVEL